MAEFFSWLKSDDLAIREMAVADARQTLFPIETCGMEGAVASRIQEFTAGRQCARLAMADLGIAVQPIPAGEDRAPLWPTEMTGSITHTKDHCAAALARRDGPYLSIGIDLELADALPPELVDIICLPEERNWLDTQPARHALLLARAIFSAKESAYKALYPVTGQFLDFSAMTISLQTPSSSFSARLMRDCQPFKTGHTLSGELRIAQGYIASAVILHK